jgi:hypothetical protein
MYKVRVQGTSVQQPTAQHNSAAGKIWSTKLTEREYRKEVSDGASRAERKKEHVSVCESM